jgi:capsid protein
MVEAVQWQVVIPMFCQRIWDWVMEAAWTAGALPQPEIAVEWAPPRFESVNPLQDVTADLMEVRAGFSTPAQQIARRGYDPREVVEEWQKYAALFDQLGLIFDADPRRVSRAGLAQAVDATDRDPPPDER